MTARTRAPADLAAFTGHVQAARAAFGNDVSYAVAIARAAVTITRKRAIWSARRELRAAHTDARVECAATAAFTCTALAACGVGDCKFARGDLARLTVAATVGPHHRPQAHSIGGDYSLEEAVNALAALRAPQPV